MKSNNKKYSLYRKLYGSEWRLWNLWGKKKDPCYVDVDVHPRYQEEQGFINLIDDIGGRPSADHDLCRFNKFGDYEPGNIGWKTKKSHFQNTRRLTQPDEYTQYLKLAEANGIEYHTFYSRVKRGWNMSDAATLKAQNLRYKNRLVE